MRSEPTELPHLIPYRESTDNSSWEFGQEGGLGAIELWLKILLNKLEFVNSANKSRYTYFSKFDFKTDSEFLTIITDIFIPVKL